MKKRLISIVLTICMVLAMMPAMSITASAIGSGSPGATTGAATDVEPNKAMLSGTVDANYTTTTVKFEYGTTEAYGNEVTYGWPVDGFGNESVACSISGLTPSTTYHYRVVATNENGTAYGDDMTFTTPPVQVHVGGTDVVSGTGITYWLNDDAGGITSAGADENHFNIKYAPNTGGTPILTLKGANIATGSAVSVQYYDNYVAAIWADGDVDMLVEGTNEITGPKKVGGESAGILVLGNLNLSGSGSLTAVGGDVNSGGTNYDSYGIWAIDITVRGIDVIARGGEAKGVSAQSRGIYGSLILDGGAVTAEGGPADYRSTGLSARNCTVNSGTLTAKGGESKESVGIMLQGFHCTITGGTVKATGGTATKDSIGVYDFYNLCEITISGGELTAVGGAGGSSSYGFRSGVALVMAGGTVTAKATGTTAQVMSKAPDLSGYTNVQIKAGDSESATASITPDNLTDETVGTYKYLRFEPSAEATPNAGVDYRNEKLTGVSPSAIYIVNGTDVNANDDGTITIDDNWFGKTISLVKKGNSTTSSNSIAQGITLAARAAAPACTATQPSADSAKGAISGITTAMEYSIDNGNSWIDGNNSDVTELDPGTVLIRVKAADDAPAGLIQSIIVNAYSAPPSRSGGGGGRGGSSGNSGGSVADGVDGNIQPDPSTGTDTWNNPFIDVEKKDWFYSAVEYANKNGLFAGTGTSTFSPHSSMTRAMLWTVLGRMDGQNLSGSGVYDAARSWAMNAGISDGTNPYRYITREQMVAILWRYAGYPQVDGDLSKFSDADQVSDYAKDAMVWAVENGIVAGSNGALMPKDNIPRAQVAAILQRFAGGV